VHEALLLLEKLDVTHPFGFNEIIAFIQSVTDELLLRYRNGSGDR
jgi:hypothetical protein